MQRSETPAFGRIPEGATHWSIRRRTDYAWEWCTFGGEDDVARQDFPIGDLSIPLVKRRWGPGTYRVMFVSITRGVRQVFGNGKVFEIVGSQQRGAPRATGPTENDEGPASATADHSEMVRALLRAGEGRKGANELFEALAVPTGIGLGNLFAFQERAAEKLAMLERRLAAIEARLDSVEPPRARAAADPWARVLDKLEAIEGRLPPARKSSPTGGRRSTPR